MQNEKEQTPEQLKALIAQLPAEMQMRLNDPTPTLRDVFNKFLYSPTDLRKNLTYLLIDHLRVSKIDWDDEEFEDFKILLETFEISY